jgi:hypothetical protein
MVCRGLYFAEQAARKNASRGRSEKAVLSHILFLFTAAIGKRRGNASGAKLGNGKRHLFKDAAGLLFIGNDALLIGDAVFLCRNDKLPGALHSDHGKEAEADVKMLI